MGLLDKVKNLVKGKEDKVVEGVDKATDVVDDKTEGKYSDQLDKVDEAVEDQLSDDD